MAVEGIPQRDVVVTFRVHYASYNPGEDAHFTEEEAQRLLDEGVAVPSTDPPQNFAVPYVSQAGDTLSCTMGEWTGHPTSYAYQWQIAGADAGTDSADYTVTIADVGNPAICIVTATNAHGSATAPPSNQIVIVAGRTEETG